MATSPDFLHWSAPRTILAPDARDDEWVQDDEQRSEFYGMAGFCYGGQFLGFLPAFDVMVHSTHERDREPELRTEPSPWKGPLAAQLVHSRDGLNWHRFGDRSPIIPRGARGSFDAGCILCSADRPLVQGDEVWHYYTGINTMHGGPMPPKQCVIGRVSWRLDGFVSLDAAAFEGQVETVPLATAGGRLVVNAGNAIQCFRQGHAGCCGCCRYRYFRRCRAPGGPAPRKVRLPQLQGDPLPAAGAHPGVTLPQ